MLKYRFKRSLQVLLGVLFLFQIYLFIRMYWIISCVIPTYSMSPTLIEGDYIITTLQIPGRRVLEENPDSTQGYVVHRKEGFRPVRKNDVVVFNFPYAENKGKMVLSMKQFYCKRCVAVPGDTYQWDSDSHSVYLPKKGDRIILDSTNYRHYHKCIEYETGKQMRLENNRIYLSDSLLIHYSFHHDYYFMRGDHTEDSYDSRFWGILPDDFILGVGQFIWYSKDKKTGKVRWERIFTKL